MIGQSTSRTFGLLLFLALVFAPSADGQTLRGILVDERTAEPVALGTVTLIDADRDSLNATLTSEEGYFELIAPDGGSYTLFVEAFGYWAAIVGPFEIEDDENRVVEARLSERPVSIPGVSVDAQRLLSLEAVGFYDRMDKGRGDFITPGDILASGAAFPQQLFYGRRTSTVRDVPARRSPTARVNRARLDARAAVMAQDLNPATRALRLEEVERRYGAREYSATRFGPWGSSVLIRQTDGGLCPPWLYVDGIRIVPNPGESLADIVPLHELRAVEIYRAPFEGELNFRDISKCECGALVMWTRMADD